MRERLLTLVRVTSDPYHLVYVVENLKLPRPLPAWHDPVVETYQTAAQRLVGLSWQTRAKIFSDALSVWTEINARLHQKKNAELQKSLRELADADVDTLRARLRDNNPLYRVAAAQVIYNRRLHLERELIDRLDDVEPLVREAARQTLVRLARGADFGPSITAAALERHRAMDSWRDWLALQGSSTPSASTAQSDPAEIEAARLAAELVQAGPDQEGPVLQRLQAAPEPEGTLALAVAITELKGTRQERARQFLAERLAYDDSGSLRKRLGDDHAEVRRAAMAAAAAKKDATLVPDILKLLEDPDAKLAQSARLSLKSLTGRDFGPAANASPFERAIAIGQWYQWWTKREH
jgi:hypothetical protein